MTPAYLDCPDAFTAAQCDALVALAEARGLEPGPVWGGTAYGVSPDVRRVSRAYLPRTEEVGWVYARLDALFALAAQRLGLTVGPIFEEVQVVRYDEGSHYQVWHSDAGADRHQERVLSASVELSEAAAYGGGALELLPATFGRPRTLPRGGARLFPSRVLHRVTPVTRGVRYALVVWTGVAQGRTEGG